MSSMRRERPRETLREQSRIRKERTSVRSARREKRLDDGLVLLIGEIEVEIGETEIEAEVTEIEVEVTETELTEVERTETEEIETEGTETEVVDEVAAGTGEDHGAEIVDDHAAGTVTLEDDGAGVETW